MRIASFILDVVSAMLPCDSSETKQLCTTALGACMNLRRRQCYDHDLQGRKDGKDIMQRFYVASGWRLTGSLAVSLIVLFGCAPDAADESRETQDMYSIAGQLAYRERIALPPETVAHVQLLDVSIADTASPVVGEQTIELGGRQVPIPFEITVASDALESNRRYALRGTLQDANGQLLWTTDSAHMVDPAEKKHDLGALQLIRVDPQSPPPADSLVDVEWVVEDVGGRGVMDFARATVNFDAQGRLWGLGTCNNYTGSYERTGDTISVGPLAVTNKACPEAMMRQEDALLKILGDASEIAWSDTDALIIRSSAGEEIVARGG